MTTILIDPKAAAQAEIIAEDFRTAVDAAKVKLRARRWWHVLFPWKLMILRRDT